MIPTLVTLCLWKWRRNSHRLSVPAVGVLPDNLRQRLIWITTVKPPLDKVAEQYARRNQVQELQWLTQHFPFAIKGEPLHQCAVFLNALGMKPRQGQLPQYVLKPGDYLRIACGKGHLEMVQWLTTRWGGNPSLAEDGSELLKRVCGVANPHGDISIPQALTILQWIVDHYQLTTEQVRAQKCLQVTSRWSYLEVTQWLVSRFGLTVEDVRADEDACISAACGRHDLQTTQWLADHFQLITIECGHYCFEKACQYRDLSMAQWLVERFGIVGASVQSRNEYMRLACSYNMLELAQWLTEKLNLTIDDVRVSDSRCLRSALQYGHSELAQWLVARWGVALAPWLAVDG